MAKSKDKKYITLNVNALSEYGTKSGKTINVTFKVTKAIEKALLKAINDGKN